MTVKLVLLKSGEDIVADVSEMVVGDENDKENPPRVIGYYLNRPCVVRMQDARNLPELTKVMSRSRDIQYLFFLGCHFLKKIRFQSLQIG